VLFLSEALGTSSATSNSNKRSFGYLDTQMPLKYCCLWGADCMQLESLAADYCPYTSRR
jgi:hypothetical protein